MQLQVAPKVQPGDKVAIVSPSFAAPGIAPEIHEQAMRRLVQMTDLVPVEYPTTRQLRASPEARAADLNAAFGDPEIRAVLATIGGDDQITVLPHLDPQLVLDDPKPFCGYSDNTNLLNWLWTHGVAGFYGGSTQVHLGAGPHVDEVHRRSLLAALVTGERLEVTEPGESEDMGLPWEDPRSLTEFGQREPTDPWTWAGPKRSVTGCTWGGCVDVLQWVFAAGHFPQAPDALRGKILLLETAEDLISANEFGYILRSMGERGLLAVVSAVVVARPPASNFLVKPTVDQRRAKREEQREKALELMAHYNPDAVVVIGPPFGHTRPQWILPYGGTLTVDAESQRIFADYS